MKNVSRSYRDELIKELKDPKEALEYLVAAMEDGDPKVLRLALRDVKEAKARGR